MIAMERDHRRMRRTWRAAHRMVARCAVLIVIGTAGGAAQTSAPATGGPALEPASAAFALEIWYDIAPGAAADFDAYSRTRQALGPRIPNGSQRWVDVEPATGRRVVTVPTTALSSFGQERATETGMRRLMGEVAYRELTQPFNDAQLSRRSYIRKYRDDLSWNRAHHLRAQSWGTEVIFISVDPGRARDFERLWTRALAAYSHAAPSAAITVAETVAGGGASYVLLRPLASATAEPLPTPLDAVADAAGPDDAGDFRRRWAKVVTAWDRVVLQRTEFDALAGPRAP